MSWGLEKPEKVHIEDIVSFGKYKGKTIEYVLKSDKQYLLWLHRSKVLKLDSDITLELGLWKECKRNPFRKHI